MSCSIYNGKIVDRDCGVFKEGNVPLLKKLLSNETPLDLLLRAICNGEKEIQKDGSLWINPIGQDYWVEIRANGEIEIGEGAA